MVFEKNATVAELEFYAAGSITGIVFWLTLPFSWGSVHLRSFGEINDLVIDVGLVTIDLDMDITIGAGRLAREIWSTKPLSDLVSAFISPGEAVLPINVTDVQWADFITTSCKQ